MRNRIIQIGLAAFLLLGSSTLEFVQAQKVWASGAARSIFQQNNLDAGNDTVTPQKLNSGHALVDLALNARPNDQTYLHAMVRIRNDFGGFWGSGVTFDMRQLYLKGLIKNAVRYQLGDIDYKLSKYTFFNNQEELSTQTMEALEIYREITHYDLFYTANNTWRQQGAALDFSLVFPTAFEELQMNLFAFRNRRTDFGQQNERIFFGGNGTLIQSKTLHLGANFVDMMDLNGTSRNPQSFHNPVVSGTTRIKRDWSDHSLQFNSESGISEMYTLNDPDSKTLRDYFMDAELSYAWKKRSQFRINFVNVGPDFRSAGAQNKRINFEAQNLMYTRIGNEQKVRPVTQLDLIQDASLYRMNLSTDLEVYAPQYDNITPFGTATPNRKGLTFNGKHETRNKAISAQAQYRMLSEVIGQGTTDLRSFSSLNVTLSFKLDTLLPAFDKPLEFSIGYTDQNTSRSNAIPEAIVDLSSTIFDVGLKIGLLQDMDLVANFRSMTANGNEILSLRNNYSEVVDYEPFTTEMTQQLFLLALRYHFDERNKLNAVWQNLNYSDDAQLAPDFNIKQFGIVYSMFF